jgi:hypothetical protein
MAIPKTANVKIESRKDPKLWDTKGMTSLFMEKIAAVNAIGEIYICDVVRGLLLDIWYL